MSQGLLANRYILLLGLLALGAIGWNAYVVLQDDGRGVAGARVTLSERTLTTLEPRAEAVTGADGVSRFVGQPAHHFALEARKDGAGAAPRSLHRRWFRGQNLWLQEPLRLRPGT